MTEILKKISTTDIRNVLAILVVMMAAIFIMILLFVPVPPENKDLVNVLGGTIVGGGLGSVVGYYFGASKVNPKEKE